jgi:coniferyl-aldehyde dehydrogenase
VALKIAHGKLLNAGQTCIAPDYLLLPRGRERRSTQACRRAVARCFRASSATPTTPAIITERHHARLQALLDEARAAGATRAQTWRRVRHRFGHIATASRRCGRRWCWAPTPTLRLLQEEIFGPILPVLLRHGSEDDRTINAGPRPLALYWFGTTRPARAVLRRPSAAA